MPLTADDKLLELQKAAKERHSGYVAPIPRKKERRKIRRFSPVCYMKIDPFIAELEMMVAKMNGVQKVDFSIERFKKDKPAKEIPLPKYYREAPVRPDVKKSFERPPAQYSNKSPYGIADELHRKTG